MRDHFTFMRSFYEAISDLKDSEQLKLYRAIAELSLNENEIEIDGISKTIFKLIKPIIVSGNNKSQNSSKTNRKQTENKKETKEKQSESKEETNPSDGEERIGEERIGLGGGEEISDSPSHLITSFLDMKEFILNNSLDKYGKQNTYFHVDGRFVKISRTKIPYFPNEANQRNLTHQESDMFYKNLLRLHLEAS